MWGVTCVIIVEVVMAILQFCLVCFSCVVCSSWLEQCVVVVGGCGCITCSN